MMSRKTFEKESFAGVRRLRRWKRWYTVLVGRDHRRDRRKSNSCQRRKKNRARWHRGSGSSEGGRGQGGDPLCIIGDVVKSGCR